MSTANPTPMVRQYRELKAQHPGALLFFRLGDFYELFFEDAVIGARELQITLTARHKERGDPIPMCGVPHHSAANYIAKLVRKGYRVAICEQTEDPSKTKKLVRREVARIVTPGTPIDPQLLEARETIYLAAVCARGEICAAAFLDLSTGEFRATQATGADAWLIIAAAIIADIVYFEPHDHLVLDTITVRNLELVEPLGEGATSLLNVIDETVTGMGARLLRSWLLRPSVRRGEVEARLGAVGELYASHIKRDRLRTLLKEVADVERLAGRLNLGSTTPRDLVALRRSLDQVPQIREALINSDSSLLQILSDGL